MSKIQEKRNEMQIRKATYTERAEGHTCLMCGNHKTLRRSKELSEEGCGLLGDGTGRQYRINTKDTCNKWTAGAEETNINQKLSSKYSQKQERKENA